MPSLVVERVVGESVEDRARKCIGRTWWLRNDDDGLTFTVALSFKEICDVIREFDGEADSAG